MSCKYYRCNGLTSITIPNSVTTIGDWAFAICSGLTSITSFIQEPFATTSNCWYIVPKSIPLYVPYGTKEKYQNADQWKDFFFVEEGDPTPVERIEADTEKEAEIIGIYDLNGTKKQSMQRGLNIIRMSDGTTRKVMVK